MVKILLAWLAASLLATGPQPDQLGPLDGERLPAQDLDRVQVGSVAPDFRLMDHTKTIHQLSQYRGRKNVVLVFFRGHW